MNLNQVTLPVADIPRAKAFYRSLGFQLLVEAAHYCRFAAPAGESTLSIELDAERDPRAGGSGAIVYFECESREALDAACAALKSRGVALDTEPADQRWLWREARLKDPDGHRLVLYFAGRNRRDPPWRVKPSGDNLYTD